MNSTGIWIGICVVGLIVLSLSLTGGEAGPTLASEFTLPNLNGEMISLSSLRGNVILLDFWASWCKPCKTTLPELHALRERYAEQGVLLLTISLDRSEESARRYMEGSGLPVDGVLWGSWEQARAVKELYGVWGIPRTFVVDRGGYIRFSGHPSHLTAEDLEPWL